MADAWIGISSLHIDSLCGETGGDETLANALDGLHRWTHYVDEAHWFILDLGQTYTIKKVRGRSIQTDDPIDVDVFVSDSKVDWGAAVASGISTWQDTAVWQEVDSTDKEGQYIKVFINDTEDAARNLRFGDHITPFAIFDAYGSVAAAAGWSHKYLGVANASIGKISGVAIADIGKVNGVA